MNSVSESRESECCVFLCVSVSLCLCLSVCLSVCLCEGVAWIQYGKIARVCAVCVYIYMRVCVCVCVREKE